MRMHGHDPGAMNAPIMSKTTIAILDAGAGLSAARAAS